jgi:PAS domain S-box-containing protein
MRQTAGQSSAFPNDLSTRPHRSLSDDRGEFVATAQDCAESAATAHVLGSKAACRAADKTKGLQTATQMATVEHARAAQPARYSLRWQLPIFIAAVIVAVVAVFLAFAYRETRATLVLATMARAQAAVDQLGAMMAQSAQQRLADLHRAADQPAVRQLLHAPTDESRAAATAALSKLAQPGTQLIEVWTRGGQRILAIPIPATAIDVLPGGPAPSGAGIAPLKRRGDTVFSEHVVDVAAAGDRATATAAEELGFIVVRRSVGAATTAEVLNRLVGRGTIAVGNRNGPLWTDFRTIVDPPPSTIGRGVASVYSTAAGRREIGALVDIRGTPWQISVAFPYDAALAPASAFLRRMVLVALLFTALAVTVVAFGSARITTPLRELTGVSETIAAGDYSRRVPLAGRSEIGRLSTAFNAMVDQVAAAHRDLESRVRQRTDDLDRFFSLSLDLLCIADADGRFVRVNPAWEETLGWTEADLTAAPYLDFVHPDDRASTEAAAARLAAGANVSQFENRYRHRDGSYRWLSWKAASHPEAGVVYAAARDVTDQKRASRELQQHVAELAAVNRELEAFSYSVSHDLRAPLRHIAGFATMLEDSAGASLDADHQRYLRTISDAARSMGRLIDDLLSFSRVGRTQLVRARVDLNTVVREAQREVAMDINGRSVRWHLQDLPTVQGDPSMLRLVFVNLLSNALKYSAGRAPAEIDVGTIPGEDAETVLFVRDNGVGFDMQYADKLFGVFQRLHSADEFEGTGIGLANVRRIVQRHGGRTWAEGRVDAGATFYFSLPDEGR